MVHKSRCIARACHHGAGHRMRDGTVQGCRRTRCSGRQSKRFRGTSLYVRRWPSRSSRRWLAPLYRRSAAVGGRNELVARTLQISEVKFKSHGTTFSGWLISHPGDHPKPLVVTVHGSERTSPRTSTYPLMSWQRLGLNVFFYDKRGTGNSEGEYTQNFELLADDAAAAMNEARSVAAGRFTNGPAIYGGSQGGWVAPLAATRSPRTSLSSGLD